MFREGTRATVDMLIRMAEAAQALSDWETVVTSLRKFLKWYRPIYTVFKCLVLAYNSWVGHQNLLKWIRVF